MLRSPIDVAASWATLMDEADYVQQVHGFAAQKTRDDLRRYEAVITACSPEVIVETGTRYGGSALWFASHGVDVITVDIDLSTSASNRSGPQDALRERITWLAGDSVAMVGRVSELVAGRRCVVSLDSDHHAAHVAAEIRAYGPLVTPGCYLVVEDGIADLVSPERAIRMGRRIPDEGGPLVAVEAELACDPRWTRDMAIEGMTPVSHHPAGWWRRV